MRNVCGTAKSNLSSFQILEHNSNVCLDFKLLMLTSVDVKDVVRFRFQKPLTEFFFLKDPIYLQSVTIHSANGGKGEGWHVEEYSVALLC
jgi:hypothetical protein